MPSFPSLFLATLFLATSSPLKASFSITAAPAVFPENTELHLSRNTVEKRLKVRIATLSTDAQGGIQKTFDLEPGIYELELPSGESLPLAPAEGQTIAIETLDPVSVAGSPDTELLATYETFRKGSLARLVYPIRKDIKAAKSQKESPQKIAELTQIEVDNYAAHLRELNDFVLEKVGPSIALYATFLRWDGDYRASELAKLVEEFAALHGEIPATRALRERIAAARRTAPGSPAPELVGTDLLGQPRSLSKLHGRYVLIDFWASWCPPCRVENRHYKKILEAVDPESFALFGVNLDQTHGAWQKASRQDGIEWIQISDLRGWKSEYAKLYNVNALPASFLIDPHGNIVAKNLRGHVLEKKLAELLP